MTSDVEVEVEVDVDIDLDVEDSRNHVTSSSTLDVVGVDVHNVAISRDVTTSHCHVLDVYDVRNTGDVNDNVDVT